MATINFLYRSKREISTLNLRLLYRNPTTNKDITLGAKTKLEVSNKYWQKQHHLKRVNNVDIINKQTEINNELAKISSFILNTFKTTPIKDVDKEWLTNTLSNYYNPIEEVKLPTTLIEYINYYIGVRKNELSNNSIKKINVVKGKFYKFQKYRNSEILIKNVNLSFSNELTTYLNQEGYAPNTIARDIRYLKTFCNHARYNGLETSYQLEKVQAKYTPIESIYLTPAEIILIESCKDKLPEHLDNARKWLLISYYTGQRISDFLRFTMEMVRYEKGKPLIEFTQQKTGKIMVVPLSSKAIVLLKSNPRRISDQRYNDYIKVVCESVGIIKAIKGFKKVETKEGSGIYRKKEGMYMKYELISSHIGRRSFATNNYGKIPTSFLKYVTGHSTESMFLEYIGKSNKDIALELSKYLG
ncbi:site-specific integrase [Flavobacteriaceae bacterium]|nr:site-specific integrase [Flavobacteriaceae bacterium]